MFVQQFIRADNKDYIQAHHEWIFVMGIQCWPESVSLPWRHHVDERIRHIGINNYDPIANPSNTISYQRVVSNDAISMLQVIFIDLFRNEIINVVSGGMEVMNISINSLFCRNGIPYQLSYSVLKWWSFYMQATVWKIHPSPRISVCRFKFHWWLSL